MKCCILLPGKIKPKALASAQEDYVRRLKAFGVEVVEYKDEKISARIAQQTRDSEAGRILKFLRDGDYLVACDERGQSIQTMEMAELLQAARNGSHPLAGKRRIVIVVGGALGLSESVRTKANAVWSLSSLVMAGGVARIVLLEGLYRAFTLMEGHPYHNE
jgi:23S rRNA (pseudouridine1915-N3)-methyltransferase